LLLYANFDASRDPGIHGAGSLDPRSRIQGSKIQDPRIGLGLGLEPEVGLVLFLKIQWTSWEIIDNPRTIMENPWRIIENLWTIIDNL